MKIEQHEVVRMAREAGIEQHRTMPDMTINLIHFAALVAEATKEKIMDEWWMCVQSDLEHGVKSLNERAAIEWNKNYPAISTFAESVEKLK